MPTEPLQPYQVNWLTQAAELQIHPVKRLLNGFSEGGELVFISGRRFGKSAHQKALQAQNDRGPAWLPHEALKTAQKG